MDNIKLSVTFELPGSQMLTSQECEENPKESYNLHSVLVSVKKYDSKRKKPYYKKELVKYKTRKCIDAQQALQISEEAYNDMISPDSPDWYYNKGGAAKWKTLSKDQKICAHLERICRDLGGKSFEYTIFKD